MEDLVIALYKIFKLHLESYVLEAHLISIWYHYSFKEFL